MKKAKVAAEKEKKAAQRKVATMKGKLSAASDSVRASRQAAREAKMMASRAEREAKEQSEKHLHVLLERVKDIAAQLGVSKSCLLVNCSSALSLITSCCLPLLLLLIAGIFHSSCSSNEVGAHDRDCLEG